MLYLLPAEGAATCRHSLSDLFEYLRCSKFQPFPTMSTNNDDVETDVMKMCCASCGIAEIDDIKLKDCSACKLVKYCSIKCQRDHWPHHKKECKKRAAELRDELLFKQNESNYMGDCPICFLPNPVEEHSVAIMSCCSQMICHGCNYANKTREFTEKLPHKCPFCRHPIPRSDEDLRENHSKRIDAGDPVAMFGTGKICEKEEDYISAFALWSEAAYLGDAEAHYEIAFMYEYGIVVEEDEEKQLYHLEQAAIGGHYGARHKLGTLEKENGRYERAVKHYIIAAKMGLDDSLEMLKNIYREGLVSKENFASALRGHQAAVDATKSPQRKVAKANLQQAKAAGIFNSSGEVAKA